MNVIISNKQDELLSTLEIDVIKKINGEYSIDEIVGMFENFFYEKMIIDITAIRDYKDIKNLQSIPIHLDASKIILLLDSSYETSASDYLSRLVSMGIYNFTQNKDGIMYLMKTPNTYKDVAKLQQLDIESKVNEMTRVDSNRTKVLGIKNLTNHAGASTLIYMMKKQLETNYTVYAIEIDKRDFMFFNDKNMISTISQDLGKELLKLNGNVDIVLIDLNGTSNEKACNDVLYLIEPSTIKVNELVAKNKEVLEKLSDKKVILNQSLLTSNDISEFEMESGIKVFHSIPPLNDRKVNEELNGFLVKIGFLKQRIGPEPEKKQNKLLGIFGINN